MNKNLTNIVVVMTVIMVFAVYYRIFIKGDYLIKMEVDCDPTSDVCLTTESEDASSAPTYYKVIEQKAYSINE